MLEQDKEVVKRAISEVIQIKMEQFDFVTQTYPWTTGQCEWIEKTINILRLFDDEYIDNLSSSALNTLWNNANSLLTYTKSFSSFKGSQENFDKHVGHALNVYEGAFQQLHSLAAYGVSRGLNIQRANADVQTAIEGLKNQVEMSTMDMANRVQMTLIEIEKIKADAEKILEDIRAAAAETSITKQGQYFKKDSESHTLKSYIWIAVTAAFAIVLALVAILMFHPSPDAKPPTNIYEAYQVVGSRLIVFGVLSYLLVLAGRNFMSHQHNAIVNRHRYNALMSYRAIVDGATDPDVRNAILTHASTCMFSPQDTGYTKTAGSGLLNGKSVLDVMLKSDHP